MIVLSPLAFYLVYFNSSWLFLLSTRYPCIRGDSNEESQYACPLAVFIVHFHRYGKFVPWET